MLVSKHAFAYLLLLFLVGCQPLVPEIERHVRAQGQSLFIQCYGDRNGHPTVLLEHGIGEHAPSATWDKVVPQVAAFAFVCRYDQAGAGQSAPPASANRSGDDLVAELRSLLDTAGVEAPYLLVGHSFGDYPLQLFAHTYPDDVVGIVFVDSVHEELGLLRATASQAWHDVPAGQECLDLESIEPAVSRSCLTKALPITVLMRGQGRSPAWEEAQAALAALSSRSQTRVAQQSGHEIPREQPEAVTSAIRDLLEGVQGYPRD